MDEVNINKYLGQFNPILIVPVLSAVFGAILVFVFGFKRPNEPRFQSSDSLKKSKRKANAAKSAENAVQSSTKQSNASSAKVSSAKKAGGDASAGVVGKKGSGNEKSSGAGSSSSNVNNNNTSSNNNNINKKKTDEKKSENGSPAKKVANKKTGKDAAGPATANKKSKSNKLNASDDKDLNEKPADFDDGGWFTVQSKSGKQKNKVDESAGNAADANSSPKAQQTKANNKSAKSAKQSSTAVAVAAPPPPPTPAAGPAVNESENVVESSDVDQVTTTVELSKEVAIETAPINIAAEPTAAINVDDIVDTVENEVATDAAAATTITATVPAAVPAIPVVDSSSTIAFDEMGDWTDAKPDRKRGNKKKTRKD